MFLTPSRVNDWRACRYLYHRCYDLKEVPPGPPPDALLLGDWLHEGLAQYTSARPGEESEVLAIARRVVADASNRIPADLAELKGEELAALLLSYHRHPEAHICPQSFQVEQWIRANIGPLTLSCKADLLGYNGPQDFTIVDWKTGSAGVNRFVTQAVFLHAVARKLHPEAAIHIWTVSLRPTVMAKKYLLTEEAYREQLRIAYDVSREIARAYATRSWPASPGDECGWCRYDINCEYAESLLGLADGS